MSSIYMHPGSSNAYWNMLKNLGADVKLDLIAKLSASLIDSDEKVASSNWDDCRDTDDIVADIRASRSTNRDIEL